MSASWQLLPRFRSPLRRKRGRVGVAAAALVVGTLVAGPVSLTAAPVAAVALAAPGALSPNSDDGSPASQAALTDTQLTWAPVPDATSYEIAVSDSPGFDPNVLTGSSTTTSWPIPASVPAGDYVWRVRAVSADGAGDWSGAAAFTRGWESAPANLTVLSSLMVPTVRWDVLPGASFYEVEFSADPYVDNGSAMTAREDDRRFTCFTQHPYFAPYGMATGKESLPGDEKLCAVASTTRDPRDIALEKALKGCLGALLCEQAAYDARENASPTGALQYFPLKDLTGLTDLPWYVRVRGRNGSITDVANAFPDPAISCTGVWNGAGGTIDRTVDPALITLPVPSVVPKYLAVPECSSWAAPVPFLITNPGIQEYISAPVVGATAAPLAGSAVTTTPMFSWQAFPLAAKYRVYLGRTRDLRSADHVWETEATSLVPYGTIADSRKLYWGVQVCGWRTCGPISPVQSFTKYATSPVSALAADVTSVDLGLTWRTQTDSARVDDLLPATDSEARSYQVQVDPVGSSWAKPAVDVTVDASRRPGEGADISRTTVAIGSLPDNTYVWRVRAIDESGFAYPWSTGKPFLRDVSTPTAKINLGPAFDQSAPYSVTFSEPVSAPAGSLKVLNAAGGLVAGAMSGSGANWSFVPSTPWTTGATYVFSVSGAVDPGGHVVVPASLTLRASVLADSASIVVAQSGQKSAWAARSASDAVSKSYLRTSTAGSKLSTTVVGSIVRVYACKSPKSGTFQVSIDGKQVKTIDLYRSYSGCGSVFGARVSRGAHSVIVTSTAFKNKKSRGKLVGIDAIATI